MELPVCFQYGDASKRLPYADDEFDCLTLIEVISHVICEDMHLLFEEMKRVLRQGGILFISDGNNARSPRRRKLNRTLWERIENGPPTTDGEAIDGHHVRIPYIEMRRSAAERAVKGLSQAVYYRIAQGTCFHSEQEVEQATRRYSETGELPHSFYQRGTCPVDPINHIYMEKLFDPLELRDLLRTIGFSVGLITTRRKLPLQLMWDAFPQITTLLSNGFVMVARKNS